jgi:uracil-DNA glycosylase
MQPGMANGYCFSVNKKIKTPGTLRAIYNCLDTDEDIDFMMPFPMHGDLTNWAEQGVFLINSVLTSRAYQNGSHQRKGWEKFTQESIKQINKLCKNVVYILFGAKA